MRFMIGSCDEELRAVRSRTKGPPAARSGYGRTHLFSKHNERGRSPAVKRFFQNCLLLAFVDVRGSRCCAGARDAACVIDEGRAVVMESWQTFVERMQCRRQ